MPLPSPSRSFACSICLGLLASMAVSPASTAQPAGKGAVWIENAPAATLSVDQPDPPVAGSTRQTAFVELVEASAVKAWREAQASASPSVKASAVRARLAEIEKAQQAFLPQLKSTGARTLYRLQRSLNGIAVEATPEQLERLAAMPQVRAIRPLQALELDHRSSMGLIKAPRLWDGAGLGLLGSGIRVAVIDSGIDYLHRTFGTEGFGGSKVAGGFDFAGDLYNANCTDEQQAANICSRTPAPDEDPMDCGGHGTHVAGTVAGVGVLADGSSYAGPYHAAMSMDGFKVGPGVAPEAELYALRVFGCSGSTALVPLALEWAIDPDGDGDFSDRMDVVNMSLGSARGRADDASALATQAAVDAGIIVVASAGNSGDSYYVVGSPSVADGAISVASSQDSASFFGGLQVLAPASVAGLLPAGGANFNPFPLPDVTAEVLYPPPGERLGCAAFSQPTADDMVGRIALIDRGSCEFGVKVLNAQNAGAVGAVVVDNAILPEPQQMGGTPSGVTIPSLFITNSAGSAIKNALSTDPVQVRLSSSFDGQIAVESVDRVDAISGFSSRGARRLDAALKPDLTAPGQTISSALVGSVDGALSISGTSMAAPHVAGQMALLRQLHPDWSVEELKALAMNTARHQVRATAGAVPGTEIGPARIGAGRIDLVDSSQSQVVAFGTDTPGSVSLSFGVQQVVESRSERRSLRVLNKGALAQAYALRFSPVLANPGVSVELSESSIALDSGASAEIDVDLVLDADTLVRSIDPSVATSISSNQRALESEFGGHVVLVPVGAEFNASLSGAEEVPPVASPASGTVAFEYDGATRNLRLTVSTSGLTPGDITGMHLHAGLRGQNGAVIAGLPLDFSPAAIDVVLTEQQERLLFSEAIYLNIHTNAHPGGEIRGQLSSEFMPSLLRVPLHAVVQPRAARLPTVETLELGESIIMTGPTSAFIGEAPYLGGFHSAFELQAELPSVATNPSALAFELSQVGISSDVGSVGNIGNARAYFGLVTHGLRSSPNDGSFEVHFDVNLDGEIDKRLVSGNLSSFALSADSFYTFLVDEQTGNSLPQMFINAVPQNLDTGLFHSRAIVLPVNVGDLQLPEGQTLLRYRVRGVAAGIGQVSLSDWIEYDLATPVFDFNGGQTGLGIWSGPVPQSVSLEDLEAIGSLGVLLIHHNNLPVQQSSVVAAPSITLFRGDFE